MKRLTLPVILIGLTLFVLWCFAEIAENQPKQPEPNYTTVYSDFEVYGTKY